MAQEVVMPKLGMAMKEGTVSQWNKRNGDPVAKGEMIASINSEKIETEVESPADGFLLEIIVQEDQSVPPGTAICYIGNKNEEVKGDKKEPTDLNVNKEEIVENGESAAPVEESPIRSQRKQNNHPVKASPVARKMAEQAGIDVRNLQGTGPKGRVTKADVEKAIENKPSTELVTENAEISDKEQQQKIPVTGMRKVIADRMQDSLSNSAQLTLSMKADVSDLISLRNQLTEVTQKRYETKCSITDFIARAVVLSLRQHKQMNSSLIDDHIHVYDHIHLGMAVALDNGLVVPVILHAENMPLIELSKNIKSVAKEARQGELSSDKMKGSTFTITNLGAYGVGHFTPILNSPETGILGVGATEDIPVFIGDELQRRTIIPLSLTFDHRVLDGAPAAEFLRTIKEHLEEPTTILL
ncbi:dihydrolipoamide acetyltransferase family protein [Alteribacillus bidgolensis]|uniref:Dihydrolipoamide acetyltransferase component of pyruvate dehydrogenase complex n=1 Tax=Alteribacillus bidgolensis TaxID=930129 RepID=A0A1G8FXH7_9BACI|nr:dihydrolipoamide acetyltransferase family protein [Alteribacillus bidgolensis]SDH86864.1 pyruvate dehydrogenase E2 component (dihydrolipoamide acetyltransferase) [Alteribacillus bidgolensis]